MVKMLCKEIANTWSDCLRFLSIKVWKDEILPHLLSPQSSIQPIVLHTKLTKKFNQSTNVLTSVLDRPFNPKYQRE